MYDKYLEVVVYVHNFSTQEIEREYREFKASLRNIGRPCLKNKTKQKARDVKIYLTREKRHNTLLSKKRLAQQTIYQGVNILIKSL